MGVSDGDGGGDEDKLRLWSRPTHSVSISPTTLRASGLLTEEKASGAFRKRCHQPFHPLHFYLI